MPRIGRLVMEGYPHHVVQRGHNRSVVFAASEDFDRYMSDLRELKEAFGIRLYACCKRYPSGVLFTRDVMRRMTSLVT